MPRAFIVYSSKRHVPYIGQVLDIVDSILREMDITPMYLSDKIKAGELYPIAVREMISQSDMGIVVLDGLRPNVVYEYGILQKEGLEIIPLKKNDAKVSVKSFYYNSSIQDFDPSLAFGDWIHKKRALEELQDPFLDIQNHLSDCQGKHIVVFESIDDSESPKSLGNLLREKIDIIIPTLRARDGPGFQRVIDRYRNFNIGLLDQSLRLLSLFSILGWRQNFEGDDKFQFMRDAFIQLFDNGGVSMDEINNIFETLLQDELPILRKHGRHITIDSQKIITESFEYFSKNKQEFNRIITLILDSDVEELKLRFFERLRLTDTQRASDLANYLILRSGEFPNVSILQDKKKTRFFSELAYLCPSEALGIMLNWINSLSFEELETIFPFHSTLISPGNPHDSILWFLSNIAKNDQYFEPAMKILKKFSLPIVVQELDLQNQIHPYIHKLALDRFLEQCHSLLGQVNVNTRWNFIKSIAWNDDWEEKYINACIDLKFRAITTFLVREWSIPGPLIAGSVRITHYRISDGKTYEELETYRKEAYQCLMDWFNHPDLFSDIHETLFEYLYRNLSDWLKYIPWGEIKSTLETIFQMSSDKKIEFINYVDNIRSFDKRQADFVEEDLQEILQFQEELEENLPILGYFKRKLRTSPIINETENILNDLISRYIELEDSDRKTITNFLLSENSYILFKFGQKFKDSFPANELKLIIKYCSGYIEKNELEEISEFFIGLWKSLFDFSNDLWKELTEEYWDKPHMKNYLYRILIGTNDQFDDFRWKKYKELVDTQQVNSMDIIKTLRSKELPPTISVEEKRKLLIKSFDWIGQLIKLKEHNIDEIMEYSIHLDALVKKQDNILNVEVAESFIDNFSPIDVELISNLYNTDLIFKFGELASDSLKKWIKSGFSVTHQQETGEGFLEKCFEIFPDQSYEILEYIFTASQSSDNQDENHRILYLFSGLGNPKILNYLSEEQIINLYNLNSSMLAPIFGRLIRYSPVNSPFPSTLKNLIINHPEDREFKRKIFQEFSSGVRTFVGNKYDQQYSGDYMKISLWRDSATNQVFKDWLRDLHTYIDTLRDKSRDFWEELEVE